MISRCKLAGAMLFLLSGMGNTADAGTYRREPIPYGDFEHWVTRPVRESRWLGGDVQTIYAIGPTCTMPQNQPYENRGGSPWGSSNVMAKISGIVKASRTVEPAVREDGGKCCHLYTVMEHCRVAGILNLHVMVSGTIYLGEANEPISGTHNPYSHMDWGIPYRKRPKALLFDYKINVSESPDRVYSSGFGKKKVIPGRDVCDVQVILQRRWEDENGNLFARRVGTGRERFGSDTPGWVNNHALPIRYGDISGEPYFRPYMDIIPEKSAFYARNSKGKLVPVREVGWDDAEAIPTHVLVTVSSGCGEAYVGSEGNSMWIDNIAFGF